MSQKSRRVTGVQQYYQKRAKRWGEMFLRTNHWRIKSAYDNEDIAQEAFYTYLRVWRTHPHKSEADLFKLYKARLRNRLKVHASACFPNPYNFIKDVGQQVLSLDEETSVAEQIATPAPQDSLSCLSLLEKVPDELQRAFTLIVYDFIGVSCIDQRRSITLRGRQRCEPLNVALARLCGLDSSRDVLEELEVVLVNKANAT